MRKKIQMGPSSDGGSTLGTSERRYSVSRKLAQEDTKEALSKAEEKKKLKMGGLTATKQPPTPIEIDPMHTDIIGTRN